MIIKKKLGATRITGLPILKRQRAFGAMFQRSQIKRMGQIIN